MQRETSTFETPGKIKVVFKTYLTAREANSIKEDMLKVMKVDINSGATVSSEIDGSFLLAQEKKILSVLIVSLDGKTENIAEDIQDLKNDEYQAIVVEANRIYQSGFKSEK